MAYNPRRINPLDLQPRKAIGVALPFSGLGVFNSTYQTKDSIRINLINFFLTGKRERVFNPDFGAGLRDLLFEQINQDRLDELDASIRESISLYFPRVIVTNLELNPFPDQNLVSFKLSYQVSDTNIEDEVVINFEV